MRQPISLGRVSRGTNNLELTGCKKKKPWNDRWQAKSTKCLSQTVPLRFSLSFPLIINRPFGWNEKNTNSFVSRQNHLRSTVELRRFFRPPLRSPTRFPDPFQVLPISCHIYELFEVEFLNSCLIIRIDLFKAAIKP